MQPASDSPIQSLDQANPSNWSDVITGTVFGVSALFVGVFTYYQGGRIHHLWREYLASTHTERGAEPDLESGQRMDGVPVIDEPAPPREPELAATEQTPEEARRLGEDAAASS